MRVLVAGLSTQSSAAVELIIGSVFRGAKVIQHPRGPGCTTIALASEVGHCDLCVVDLAGLGWGVRTPEREAALQDSVLGDRPAIVLLPSADGGWARSAVLNDRPQPRIGLSQPASMTSLQEALLLLRRRAPDHWAPRTDHPLRPTGRPPSATAPGAGTAPDRGPAKSEAVVLGDPPSSAAPAVAHRVEDRASPGPTGLAAGADDCAVVVAPARFRLSGASRDALAQACPKLRDEAFLNLVLDLLVRGTACEIRIGSRAGIVLCPERNWAASNLSVALRKRIAQHRPMLDIIESRSLSSSEAARVARGLFGRRRDGRRPLDTFVFSFVHALLGEDPPEVDGDLAFVLRRFPDFTRLQPAVDLYLQLALHSLQRTQTAAELRATFSRHDPRQISLFIVCALLCGIATIPSPAPRSGPPPTNRAEHRPAPTRLGFIRSLLAKLF